MNIFRVLWLRGSESLAVLCAAGMGMLLFPAVAAAQSVSNIASDGTFNTGVGINGDLFTITGGITPGGGSSLFHSFSQFDLGSGATAQFVVNGADVQNVISRVTGGSISNIDGTLSTVNSFGTTADVNLFFVNPNGITFGPNARLNIGRSFVATTGSALTFNDPGSTRFDVRTATENSLASLGAGSLPVVITMTPESGSIAISNDGYPPPGTPLGVILDPLTYPGLAVGSNRLIFFVGNGLNLDGARLRAPGGLVGLISASAGDVSYFAAPNASDTSVVGAAINIDTKSVINVSAFDNRTDERRGIEIFGSDVTVTGSSNLCAGLGSATRPDGAGGTFSICGDAASPPFLGGEAGNISITARGQLTVNDNSLILNDLAINAEGNPEDIFEAIRQLLSGNRDTLFGSILIDAENVEVADKAFLSASTLGIGNAGLVLINAEDTIELGPNASIASSIGSVFRDNNGNLIPGTVVNAQGDAGGVFLNANQISMQDRSEIAVSTIAGTGSAGFIRLEAEGAISIDGATTITSNIEEFGADSGNNSDRNITVQAASLTMTNGAEIQALTRRGGAAGQIFVNAPDFVNLSGVNPEGPATGLFTSTEDAATGAAGIIFIETSDLTLSDGAVISARTQTNQSGGVVLIVADNVLLYDGGQILVSSTDLSGNNSAAGYVLIVATERVVAVGEDADYVDRANRAIDRALETVRVRSGNPNAGIDDAVYREAFARLDPFPLGIEFGADGYVESASTPSGIFAGAVDVPGLNRGQTSGGGIFVVAQLVALNRGARIYTQTSAQDSNANFERDSRTVRNGGIVEINANFIALANGSEIATRFTGQSGEGGQILLAVFNEIIASPRRDNNIVTDTAGLRSQAGEIGISGTPFLRNIARRPNTAEANDISAVGTDGARDATITGQVLEVTQVQPVAEVPTPLVDPSRLIAQGCGAGNLTAAQNIGSLRSVGSGGLAATPEQQLTAVPEQAELASAGAEPVSGEAGDALAAVPTTPLADDSPPVEAQTWRYGEQGQIVLLAQGPAVGGRSVDSGVSCHAF